MNGDVGQPVGFALASIFVISLGVLYAWQARRMRDWTVRLMQKEWYLRYLQAIGLLVALMGGVGLAVVVWGVVRRAAR